MGNEEENKKPMWHVVYSELAELLKDIDGKELYKRCFNNEYRDEFIKLHNWAKKSENKEIKNKRTGGDFSVSSFDPVQFFASFNGFGMKEQSRIDRINLYFKILGSDKKYEKIDFSGCPTPIIIALIANRNPETQAEVWSAFRDIMEKGINAQINFKNTEEWYGISIGVFTILFFWIDSKNFLPLDKNTEALFETNNRKLKYNTWEDYKKLLVVQNSIIYQVIARMAWNCTNEIANYTEELKQFGITKCPNKSLKIIAIKPLKGCNPKFLKGLKEGETYLFDKAYSMDGETIKDDKEKDIQLFNQEDLQININAIVGKNGTGKSTLVELLLAVMNNVTSKQKNKGCIVYIKDLQVELIFEDLNIYKIKIDNKNIELSEYMDENGWKEIKNLHQKDFFYNILVNYSIHSLDSSENNWIEPNFDNDCSTNIMIEPFRENGNINIQEEEIRVKKRLIVNLLEPEIHDKNEYSFRQLTENYRVVELVSKKNRKAYIPDREEENLKYYDIDKVSEIIQNKTTDKKNIEDVMPKNLFTDIRLENGVKFSELSSGEKQKIYSINSIIYHIKEIDRKKKHKHINLILDEIELYFHPELQRTYIHDIIEAIKKVGTENILGINITFITHSPFILSDIPESKILFLDKESDDIKAKTVPQKKSVKTFGANIHTLLSGSFFMEDGLMGEFAKQKINEIINFHKEVERVDTDNAVLKVKYLENQIKFWQTQSIVGEDYLKQVIRNHLIEIEKKLLGDEAKKEEIKRVEAYLKSLKK